MAAYFWIASLRRPAVPRSKVGSTEPGRLLVALVATAGAVACGVGVAGFSLAASAGVAGVDAVVWPYDGPVPDKMATVSTKSARLMVDPVRGGTKR